jgi:hypothetical protein
MPPGPALRTKRSALLFSGNRRKEPTPHQLLVTPPGVRRPRDRHARRPHRGIVMMHKGNFSRPGLGPWLVFARWTAHYHRRRHVPE